MKFHFFFQFWETYWSLTSLAIWAELLREWENLHLHLLLKKICCVCCPAIKKTWHSYTLAWQISNRNLSHISYPTIFSDANFLLKFSFFCISKCFYNNCIASSIFWFLKFFFFAVILMSFNDQSIADVCKK